MQKVIVRLPLGNAVEPLADLEQMDVFGPFADDAAAVAWRSQQSQNRAYFIRDVLTPGEVVPMGGRLKMSSHAKAQVSGGDPVAAIEPRHQMTQEWKCPTCGSTMRPYRRPNGQLDCSLCEAVVKSPDSKG